MTAFKSILVVSTDDRQSPQAGGRMAFVFWVTLLCPRCMTALVNSGPQASALRKHLTGSGTEKAWNFLESPRRKGRHVRSPSPHADGTSADNGPYPIPTFPATCGLAPVGP